MSLPDHRCSILSLLTAIWPQRGFGAESDNLTNPNGAISHCISRIDRQLGELRRDCPYVVYCPGLRDSRGPIWGSLLTSMSPDSRAAISPCHPDTHARPPGMRDAWR